MRTTPASPTAFWTVSKTAVLTEAAGFFGGNCSRTESPRLPPTASVSEPSARTENSGLRRHTAQSGCSNVKASGSISLAVSNLYDNRSNAVL
jgi:hypothetical protein